jgi:AcrR family transcriptional regulator
MTATGERDPTEKRPYLRPADRRRHLLDATSAVFERGGLTGITMVAVAAEAGVSRRLVYDHFEDLSALFEAFFEERLVEFLAAVDHSAGGPAADPADRLLAGLRETFRQSAANLAAIELIVRDTSTPELERPRRRLRAHFDVRWLPVLYPEGTDPELGGALVWTVLGGVLALANQVAAGQLDAARATALAMAIYGHLPITLATASALPESSTT